MTKENFKHLKPGMRIKSLKTGEIAIIKSCGIKKGLFLKQKIDGNTCYSCMSKKLNDFIIL